jgi:hypothetical protein
MSECADDGVIDAGPVTDLTGAGGRGGIAPGWTKMGAVPSCLSKGS